MSDDKPIPYIKRLQEELRLLIDHNESVLAYVRLLNAQVAGNTHRITELQHKIAKELGVEQYSPLTCSQQLRMQGKAYPRTCKICGKGPCTTPVVAQ
jgi:hypothetical protein